MYYEYILEYILKYVIWFIETERLIVSMLSELVADEGLIGSTEFARAVAPTLERASSQPITVRRERGEDITLLARSEWQRMRRATSLEHVINALTEALLRRLKGETVSYPSEMYWLEHFDDEDYCEFMHEFISVARDVIAGNALPIAIGNTVEAWRHSAFVLLDPEMMERIRNRHVAESSALAVSV